MKKHKIITLNNKNALIKTVTIKHYFPKVSEFLELFESVGWNRTAKRVNENKKHSNFAVSVYADDKIVGMGRVVGDGAYFTIFDIVVHKDFQCLGIGKIIMQEIIDWYNSIKDDDTFLYVNASKDRENFYEKFGFRRRPNEDVGAGMKWYEDA